MRAIVAIALSTMFLVMSSAGGSVIPPATRIVNASNSSQLDAALNAAQPGDHIVLADGSYDGFTVSNSGQSGSPIVIRAENTLGAKINGNVRIEGDDAWVIGMDVTGGGNVGLTGARSRISSSRIKTNTTAIGVSRSAVGAIVDHNEIDGTLTTPESSSEDGIRLASHSRGGDYNFHVYRNYLYGAKGAAYSGDQAIATNHNANQRLAQTGTIIEYNLIQDWDKGRGISTKTGGVTIRFNTAICSCEFVNRAGVKNQWIANWLEGDRIRIHDRDNVAIGNRARVEIRSGNLTPAEADADGLAPGYIAAENSLAAGNIGLLKVGFNFTRYTQIPANNTRIEAQDGSIQYDNYTGPPPSGSTDRTIPKAIKLTPADVGPFAPTAPKL